MALKSVNIRIDEELKKQAEILFSDFGMNMTTAFTIFAKAVVRERRIPFEITASDPFYNESNMSHLKKSINQLNQKKGTIHDIVEVENEETMV
ncbi:type II toxin-antitoxin system RelB/DinJ family antitoxin [Clostridium estertheticum]|uniref:type II toxin-antitoxin system RelB/DinJ family antitoxin n=1 Tax=Clostridium estertheticum TaxID=238834 RepID=UPI001C0DC410|nr:type II toxin-antitoxin system RelB/DinJ family antitoxin [Clostridium estertheticum]MBU3179270.1 type II toxin-antitoxin system RelB/DinJ family antitoxin [Clostridium estertheticum]